MPDGREEKHGEKEKSTETKKNISKNRGGILRLAADRRSGSGGRASPAGEDEDCGDGEPDGRTAGGVPGADGHCGGGGG